MFISVRWVRSWKPCLEVSYTCNVKYLKYFMYYVSNLSMQHNQIYNEQFIACTQPPKYCLVCSGYAPYPEKGREVWANSATGECREVSKLWLLLIPETSINIAEKFTSSNPQQCIFGLSLMGVMGGPIPPSVSQKEKEAGLPLCRRWKSPCSLRTLEPQCS